MSPTDDYFLSTGVDNSVCMWNLASPSTIAKLQLPSSTERLFASYDAGGLIFGVLCFGTRLKYHSLKLYDARSFEQGPFQDIAPKSHLIESALSKLPNVSIFPRGLQTPQWSDFAFSNDGLRILVNNQSEYLYVIDSFNAEAEPVIISRKNELGSSLPM